jgi:hypothetical protein
MSLAELLPAIRALPTSEQAELLRLLLGGMGEAAAVQPTDDRVSDATAPAGSVAEVWFPEANPEAAAAALQALREAEASGE